MGNRGVNQEAAVNGDYRVQSSVKPTGGQPGETEVRMNREPKKASQHRPHDEGASSERTMKSPAPVKCLGDRKPEFLSNGAPGKESGWGGPCSGAVEPGPNRAQQLGFAGQRGGLIRTLLEFDASDCTEQTQEASGHSVRVGHPITAQSSAKIFGFADIENRVTRIAHEIDTGALGQPAEEVATQPLDKRLRIRKEKLLNRRHRSIQHEKQTQGKSGRCRGCSMQMVAL